MNETGTEASFDREWEDVSLGRYVLVLVAWWREIVLGAVLAAVGSGALILAVQVILPKYEASSDVTIVHTTSKVELDKKFSTGVTLGERSRIRGMGHEATARRAALVGLVKSGSVAQRVTERLSGELDEEEANAAKLIERIDTELMAVGTLSTRNSSNLIRITASADSPEKAVLIVDAWAEEYVEHVNRLYQSAPLIQLGEIVAEEKRTRESHDAAQRKMETFVAGSKIGQLERRIKAKREMITNLVNIWTEMVKASTVTLLADQKNKGEAVRLLIESREDVLIEDYETLKALERGLTNAMALRSQIENGGTGGVVSNGLALLMIKSKVYAQSSGLLGALEISDDHVVGTNADVADQLTDVNALIAVLQRQIERIRTVIAEHSTALSDQLTGTLQYEKVGKNNGNTENAFNDQLSVLQKVEAIVGTPDGNGRLSEFINKLERDIQLLMAEKEKADATLAYLIQNRDMHRSALETLQNEIVELKLAMSAVTSEVRLASHALVPVDSAYPSALLVAVLSGTAGLLVSTCLAFFMNAEGVGPLLGKREAARSDRNRDAG